MKRKYNPCCIPDFELLCKSTQETLLVVEVKRLIGVDFVDGKPVGDKDSEVPLENKLE